MIWKTKEGKELNMDDMASDHIENCLDLLERRGFISAKTFYFYLVGPLPDGDMARMAVDQEAGLILTMKPSAAIDYFNKILESRGELCA